MKRRWPIALFIAALATQSNLAQAPESSLPIDIDVPSAPIPVRGAGASHLFAVVFASGIPATAHHSNPHYFDMAKVMTLEGVVLRVRWINPHIILYLQSKNEKGDLETWVIHGSSPSNAVRQVGLKDRVQPGISITARVWPSRIPLFVNDEETVLHTRPDDARQSSRIVGGGQIRFSNGDVLAFGGGPTF